MEKKANTYIAREEINKMISTVTFSSNRFLYSLETLPFYCHLPAALYYCICVWTKKNGALILMIIITDQEKINPLMSHEKIKHVHKFLMGWVVEESEIWKRQKLHKLSFRVFLFCLYGLSFFPFLIHWWLFKSSHTHAGIIIVFILNFFYNIPGSQTQTHTQKHRIVWNQKSFKTKQY